ncbi:Multicopper oxidase with three cupredoxin domains (includes cell division protein FtsP and spore coat protein CotA) [Arthrobacter subterraneus]|uniref:Copper-containing nitrite reductase n=1 Tax=Arthrobacter subterraneus TaxID=335973 RepID=A0A1G8Q522_9MICC|nr:multicopper oxidase family protein [Arthrobacter subterraneus]SDI99626.1 Multicopper oxidase with three cupredoxin domains (includes cell division protein FtsP and spore coat protein CotA) [Arthrobacter subterraneus]
MSPLTRRQLLALGAVGAGATALGGAGLWWTTSNDPGYTGDEELVEPPVLSSRDGVLELDLEAAPVWVQVGGREASVLAFNGSLPGPTLRVAPGDTIRVAMTNGLRAPTNLHVHGLHVSPEGNGDNPFLSINPGESFNYEFVLPEGHPPGTYWYHPHRHGHVADQVAAGLYGVIVVEDPELIPVTRERVMVVSDLSLDSSGNLAEAGRMQQMMGREGEVVLVNGQVRPRLDAAPGERERWRIVNACPSRYLRLQLEGQQVRLLSRDFGRLPTPEKTTEVVIAPGNRIELLVETTEGSSVLVAAPVDRGGMDAMMGNGMMGGNGNREAIELLTLEVSGDPVQTPEPVPAGPALRDLRGEPVTGRHTLDMGMTGSMGGGNGMGGGSGREATMMAFTINGREFDPARTDTPVTAGAIEEWTLLNSSPMDHPIHLHVWPMQIIEDGDRDVSAPRWQDVVNVPARGQVKVLIAFEDFPGRTVYHCHILDHEDQGMMGVVEAR